MKTLLATIMAFAFAFAPVAEAAERIPPHLASMAAQLYKGLEDQLSSGRADKERQEALHESVKLLKELGVHRWSSSPPTIEGGAKQVAERLGLDLAGKKGRDRLNSFLAQRTEVGTEEALQAFDETLSDDERNALASDIDEILSASLEKIGTSHIVEQDRGRKMLLQWKPRTGRFGLRVTDDGSGGGEEFTTLLAGQVSSSVGEGGSEALNVVPAPNNAIRTFNAADIEMMRANILGEWTDEGTGELYVFTAAERETGEVTPPREVLDEQIERLAGRLETIEDSRIFEWKNLETGEIVQQEKFRSLPEPYDYVGEKFALDNAEEEIARLERAIEEREIERDGGNLLPVERHDPAGFGDLSVSNNARSITVDVTRPDGYSYGYDTAVFDGRRISAKRTYRDVRDVENVGLPEAVRDQLIDNGWNPPGWLELDATIDVETGEMTLQGAKWALHVTYSAFFGGSPDVDRIHSPEPLNRLLRADMVFDVAEGAAAEFVP